MDAQAQTAEIRYLDVQIIAVYLPDDEQALEITTRAGRRDAYRPADPAADSDGWLHGNGPLSFTSKLRFAEAAYQQESLDLLCRWRDEEALVLAFASESERAVGFGRYRDDGSLESFAIRLQTNSPLWLERVGRSS
jgi:hypothetical protein